MSLDNSWVNLYSDLLHRTKIDLVNNFERILHTLVGEERLELSRFLATF